MFLQENVPVSCTFSSLQFYFRSVSFRIVFQKAKQVASPSSFATVHPS